MKPSKKTQARLDLRTTWYERVHASGLPMPEVGDRRCKPQAFTRPGSRKKVC